MKGNDFKQLLNKQVPQPQKHIRRTEHVQIQVEDDRTGMSLETLKRAFMDNLYYLQGKDRSWANAHDYYTAFA